MKIARGLQVLAIMLACLMVFYVIPASSLKMLVGALSQDDTE